jgi:hypothetical protein
MTDPGGRPSSAADEHLVKLGALPPVIRPWKYEQRFWASDICLAAATDVDAIHLFIRACENVLLLIGCYAGVPDAVVGPCRRQCHRILALVGMHVALKVLLPEMYKQSRWLLTAHMR